MLTVRTMRGAALLRMKIISGRSQCASGVITGVNLIRALLLGAEITLNRPHYFMLQSRRELLSFVSFDKIISKLNL